MTEDENLGESCINAMNLTALSPKIATQSPMTRKHILLKITPRPWGGPKSEAYQ